MNYAKKRIEDDIQPIAPGDDIPCKNCKKRFPGAIGYKNRYCKAYDNGKPNDILFDGGECGRYERENSQE